jgi:hypothetical protein
VSLREGSWLRIVRGNPTPEEIAALVLALDEAETASSPPARTIPAWQRAARLEALGAAPVRGANDPRLHHAISDQSGWV